MNTVLLCMNGYHILYDHFFLLLFLYMKEKLTGSPKHRWECNVKIDFTEIKLESVVWITLAQGRKKGQTIVTRESLFW